MCKFTVIDGPQVCASSEAEGREYYKYDGRNGETWLVANQLNAADNIYVWKHGPSDGFGGREIKFTLVSGEVISLKGPWQSNSEALFISTGIDIRYLHSTFGVIARYREYDSKHQMTLTGIVYGDDNWVTGTFDRIKNLAQKYANAMQQSLYYYSRSKGGSVCAMIKPEVNNGTNSN